METKTIVVDTPTLQDLQAAIKEIAFPGASTTSRAVCISCHKQAILPNGRPNPDLFYSELGWREFRISQVCEICFDAMFAEPEEEQE